MTRRELEEQLVECVEIITEIENYEKAYAEAKKGVEARVDLIYDELKKLNEADSKHIN
jgi:hypothetical protein